MNASFLQRSTLFLFLVAIVWFSFNIIQPPEPRPAASPDTEFSAERAFSHVLNIAQKPHPIGSAANDSVRQYIIAELEKLGLSSTVQEGVSSRDGRVAGYTKNIIAELPGNDSEKTIMLMAHYDSVPNSPGASDDASGVAAILETLRAIQAQDEPLKNDLLIVITDGEEVGLLGAELFTERYPDLDEIDLTLNVEARGSSGASMMFESSSPNGRLIQHFAQAADHPVGNSLMYTVYQLMPNDTDLSVIKEAGINGLNFAFAEQLPNYHTMQDNAENLSLASLQHHGSNLTSNVRYFGNNDFSLESDSEFVYFNNFTSGLIYYPASWSFPLALITALLFITFLVLLFRSKVLTLGTYLGSMLLFLGMVIVTGFGTYFGWQAIRWLHPEYPGVLYNSLWYLLAFTFLTTGLFSSVYSFKWIRKRMNMHQLMAGGYTFWVAISLVASWYLPTASYLFTWAALLALVGWIVLTPGIEKKSWRSAGFLMLSLLPVLFLIPPYIYLVQVMLTTEMLAISMVLVVFVLGLAWPMIDHITGKQKRYWNSLLILIALGCFTGASLNAGFDADHKKQNSINYVADLDSGKAYWFTHDQEIDAWTQQFLGENYQRGSLPDSLLNYYSSLKYSEAAMISLRKPEFELVADSVSGDQRFLTLLVNAGEKGSFLRMAWAGSSVQQLQIFEKAMGTGDTNSYYYFQNLSDPVRLQLTIDNNTALPDIRFNFYSYDLPTHLIDDYREREPFMMPAPSTTSNVTIWRTTFRLDSLATAD